MSGISLRQKIRVGLVSDETDTPAEVASPRNVALLCADRPAAGVIAGESKPGHVAREFLRGTNASEPCDPRQLREATTFLGGR